MRITEQEKQLIIARRNNKVSKKRAGRAIKRLVKARNDYGFQPFDINDFGVDDLSDDIIEMLQDDVDNILDTLHGLLANARDSGRDDLLRKAKPLERLALKLKNGASRL